MAFTLKSATIGISIRFLSASIIINAVLGGISPKLSAVAIISYFFIESLKFISKEIACVLTLFLLIIICEFKKTDMVSLSMTPLSKKRILIFFELTWTIALILFSLLINTSGLYF